MMPDRWYPPQVFSNAIDSLLNEIGKIPKQSSTSSAPTKQDDTQKMVFGFVAIVVVMLMLLVGFLVAFGERDPDHEFDARSIVSLITILVGLPLGTYVWAKYFYGAKAKKNQERVAAFQQIANENQALNLAGFTKLSGDSIGYVPWLASEMDMITECQMFGLYRKHQVAILECTYVVDMTLSSIEASVGKLGSKLMSHVQHEQVRRQSLEAYIFLEPQEGLPDIFWANKKKPLNWYFRRQVEEEPIPGRKDFLITSDEVACQSVISPRAQNYFEQRPDCIVQVMGGYVMLIPITWDWNRPVKMPSDYQAVNSNLNWACDLFETLTQQAATASPSQPSSAPERSSQPLASSSSTGSAFATTDTSPYQAQSGPGPSLRPEKQPLTVGKILLALFGMGLMGVGLLVVVALLYMTAKASNAVNWPQTVGLITVSEMEESASKFKTKIAFEYSVEGKEYTSDKLVVGGRETGEKAEIQAILDKYPVDSKPEVYYNPSRHEDAVLEPRLATSAGGIHTCGLVFGGILAGVGLLCTVVGFKRKKLA